MLDAAGLPLAGPPQLAEPARALLAAAGAAGEVEAVSADGVVCAVRSPLHALLAVCGRFAIAGVIRAGPARRARGARGSGRSRTGGRAGAGSAADGGRRPRGLERAAEALISAVQRGLKG